MISSSTYNVNYPAWLAAPATLHALRPHEELLSGVVSPVAVVPNID